MEFNVPPVIFPSSSSSTSAAFAPQHRRAPTPSFTPSNPNPNAKDKPSLPFMSFDIPSSSSLYAPPRSIDRCSPMANEFNVSQVIFPSLSSSTSAAFAPQHRPAPTPSFTPANPSPNLNPNHNPSLPFLSFDITSSSSFYAPVFASSGGSGGSGGSLSFDEEPPLLKELGINTGQILRKTISILNPFLINHNLHEDSDLSGPFIFLMAFGLFQLLAGKFHFGIILGWFTVCALFIYFVFNMLAGRRGNLYLCRSLSVVGYCMIPMVIFSAVAKFVPSGGAVMFGLAVFFVMWSTRVCTSLLVELASCGDEHRGLIAYPCLLVYTLFSLLVVF